MKPRFAMPAVIFSVGAFGLSTLAAGEQAAEEPPVLPKPAAIAPADNPTGFLGVAVVESIAPPDAGPDVPRTLLLVSDVMPDSSAEAAGLRSGDLLIKIDGQQMLHPVQLRRFVAMQAGGQAVELTVMRNGETLRLPATLGERPAELAAEFNGDPGLGPAADRVPGDLDWQRAPRQPLPLEFKQMQERMDRQFEQMRELFQQGMDDGWPGGEMWERADPIEFDMDLGILPSNFGQKVTVIQDQDHKITVTQTQAGRHLHAADADGQVLFDGPIDTPAQLATIPDAVRAKLPPLENNGPLDLRMWRPQNPADFFDRLKPDAQPPTDNDQPGEQLPVPPGRAV